MKKKLLLVVLALAILTSLTAGTLAVYTRTVTKTATVEAKKFAFSVEGSIEDGNSTINLAPSESMDYNFSITNVDENDAVAEIALEYRTTITFSGATAAMPGLTVKLYKDNAEYGDYSVPGQITFTTQSEADVEFLGQYVVRCTWLDNDDDETQTAKGAAKVSVQSGLTVSVVAEQIAD